MDNQLKIITYNKDKQKQLLSSRLYQWLKKAKKMECEETKENVTEEMADVMEVIYAMLEYRGVSMDDVEKVRIEKRNRKGAFKDKVFLKDVEEE